MDAQETDMLMHMDTVNYYCYCVLWVPQQMDMLLHMDIVNTIVIVIVFLNMILVLSMVMVWHLVKRCNMC